MAGGNAWVIQLAALGVAAIMAVQGWRAGLLRGLASLAAFAVALCVAATFAPGAARLLDPTGADRFVPNAGPVVTFLFVFAFVYLIVSAFAEFFRGRVKTTTLGIANRIGGALVGGAKAVLIIAIAAIVVMLLPLSYRTQEMYVRSDLVDTSVRCTRTVFRKAEPHATESIGGVVRGTNQMLDAIHAQHDSLIASSTADLPLR